MPPGFLAGSYMAFGGQNVYLTLGLSSNKERNTLMPSTMDVRSFGSMRIQSSSNHRLTASNWATLCASPVAVGASYARYEMPARVRVSSTSWDQSVHVSCPL